MLIDRLVFGCARLTGGLFGGEARALVEAALAVGFRRFDTAPSYGIGTAEAVIGAVVGSRPEVAITAKVGSARPGHALAKTAARRALRLLRGGQSATAPYEPVFPGSSHEPDGDFALASMQRSLATTLAALRREAVSHLLLHESYAAPPAAAVVAFLEGLRAEGIAEQVGFANSAVYDPALHAACPAHWIAQAAIHPAMLVAPFPLPGPVILHSLVKTHRWLERADPAYAGATTRTLERCAGLAPREALSAVLPFHLVACNVPGAKLIYATSDAARLADFGGAAAAIEASGEALADGFLADYRATANSAP